MLRFVIKAANSIISFIVIVCLCVSGAYAVYALWDNSRIYSAAEDVQADMIKLKPKVTENAEEGPSFQELLAVNPDVGAWVTLDNTKIDYPVLQGDTNLTYINQDVYGNFALAGSIYLDSRNDPTYGDAYSLLYGHHMENSRMFGDLDLYKVESFFNENTTGTLILPDRIYDLEIFACLLVPASENAIFEPGLWQNDINGLVSYAEQNAMHLHENTMEELAQREEPKVLALSTCSTEFTDARTIVLAEMKPHDPQNQPAD